MDAKTVNKYKNKTVAQLLKLATKHFNAYIRHRDAPDGWGRCISSGRMLEVSIPGKPARSHNAHAGHFYEAGKYPALRFNEYNVNLQSLHDNYFLSGNLIEYRRHLIEKWGEEKVKELDRIAQQSKRGHHKWDRFTLIEIIEKYKNI